MSDETATPFKLPAGIEGFELEECANCHSLARPDEMQGGVCPDCITLTERALAADAPPPREPEAFQLDVGTTDEIGLRRELRRAVQAGAVKDPQGWLQYAEEQVRSECVRGRHGHEFTIDSILDQLEAARAPMPPQAVAMRFVMEQAITRGWCEATDRTQPGRREGETDGRQVRIYVSRL